MLTRQFRADVVMNATNSTGNCTLHAATDLAGPISVQQLRGCCKGDGIREVAWHSFGEQYGCPRLGGSMGCTHNKLEWFTPGTQQHTDLIGGILNKRGGRRSVGHAVAFRRNADGFTILDSARQHPVRVQVGTAEALGYRAMTRIRAPTLSEFLEEYDLHLVIHNGEPYTLPQSEAPPDVIN